MARPPPKPTVLDKQNDPDHVIEIDNDRERSRSPRHLTLASAKRDRVTSIFWAVVTTAQKIARCHHALAEIGAARSSGG